MRAAERFGSASGLIAALVLSGAFVLSACGRIVERHCLPGEIVLSNEAGGARCEPRAPADRTCPGGQVLERQVERRRERCIPDRVDRTPSPATEWLPATGG